MATHGNNATARLQPNQKHQAHQATTSTAGVPATPHTPGPAHVDSLAVAMTGVGLVMICAGVLFVLLCRALLRYIHGGKGGSDDLVRVPRG